MCSTMNLRIDNYVCSNCLRAKSHLSGVTIPLLVGRRDRRQFSVGATAHRLGGRPVHFGVRGEQIACAVVRYETIVFAFRRDCIRRKIFLIRIDKYTQTHNWGLTILDGHLCLIAASMMRVVRTKVQTQHRAAGCKTQQLQLGIPVTAHAMRQRLGGQKGIGVGVRHGNAQHDTAHSAIQFEKLLVD